MLQIKESVISEPSLCEHKYAPAKLMLNRITEGLWIYSEKCGDHKRLY